MIALLTGKIVSKKTDEVIVDVMGVGYRAITTLSTFNHLPEIGETVTLHISTYVREDTLVLYGFFTPEEKEIFVKLLKVNGIGPKLAVAILSGVGPRDFIEAVCGEDLARLNAIPGVGKKTAERIIIDLRDKLLRSGGLTGTTPGTPSSKPSVFDDALSALINLGYHKANAEMALGKVGVKKDDQLSIVIKGALKELSNI